MSYDEYRDEVLAATPYAWRQGELERLHANGWEVEEVVAWADEELDSKLQGSDEMMGDL